MFYIKEEARGRGVREKYGGEIERKGREREMVRGRKTSVVIRESDVA